MAKIPFYFFSMSNGNDLYVYSFLNFTHTPTKIFFNVRALSTTRYHGPLNQTITDIPTIGQLIYSNILIVFYFPSH